MPQKLSSIPHHFFCTLSTDNLQRPSPENNTLSTCAIFVSFRLAVFGSSTNFMVKFWCHNYKKRLWHQKFNCDAEHIKTKNCGPKAHENCIWVMDKVKVLFHDWLSHNILRFHPVLGHMQKRPWSYSCSWPWPRQKFKVLGKGLYLNVLGLLQHWLV